ncbi:MAG: undecaprenyldiphospho-muramoylpentapeptide beta-N-acetylglucosaminyltransferase [Bacteroidetes bacterium]|nr:undecaprenyldiphospho-muramoylpentapeptide beta-N-acetylglucosaminyltransferase [Bacteroidota bacterium]
MSSPFREGAKHMKVIISGGGTGGHIFPAIAIASALKKIDEKTEILFVGAKGRMEMEKVPSAGYKIEGLWISGLQRRLTIDNLSFPFKVISSLMKSKKIIKSFRPDVAVGTGGFASGPLLRTASGMNIPCLIQEQNSFPGITNKLLGKRVNKICVAYEGMEKYFPKEKIIVTGNPVRQDILSLEGKREKAFKDFSLNPNKKTVLFLGGSLGARTINQSVASCMDLLIKNNIQIIWQTGQSYIQYATEVTSQLPREDNGVRVYGFLSRMDLAYACADIVVSRAGAISLSELAIVKKPCILVPSPNVAEDHQTKNAMALVKKDSAILVKDSESREKLGQEIISLMNDTQRQTKLSQNIFRLAFPNSAEVIAKEVMKLTSKQ